jgi:hypothetical protein
VRQGRVIFKTRGTDNLNERQALYVQFVVEGIPRAEAVRRAGYRTKWPDRFAVQLTKTDKIAAAIAQLQAEMREKKILSLEASLYYLANIARANPKDYYDARGNLIPIEKLPRELAYAIASFEVTANGKPYYKLHSPTAAITVSAKIQGFIAPPSVNINNQVIEMTDEQRQRIFALAAAIQQSRGALPAPRENEKAK